jgi:hypothetical protein
MFTASYPAQVSGEGNGKEFFVRFIDIPEVLTGETTWKIRVRKPRTASRKRWPDVFEEAIRYRLRPG